ncbi:MAG: efflux RND transporter periplasmic adaptor subunit [Candidatus Zixiibacteriota bacterium]|nr:MAG: efflux RND transporter periplasmic adaptor subunit [candidate division Zixibacteria bacterium]
MMKNKFSIPIMICLVFVFSCGEKNDEKASKEKAISVTVARVEPRDLSLDVIYTGTLEGDKQAKIFASIPEAVVELPIKEGNRVQKGQAVIILDKSGVSSQYNQAKAVYVEAKDNYSKMENLYKNGAISQQAYNSSRMAYEVAEANFESARQQVELTSPISGILTDLSVNTGEFVQPGLPLATVAQTGIMRLVVFIERQNIGFVKKGQKAKIFVELSGSNSSGFAGVIREVSESADPETRLFRVEIQINNPGGDLKPGMFARANITIANLKAVLTVPTESVFSTDGIYKVFTVDGDKAVEKSIGVSEMTRDYVVISSGLEEGEEVIVLGRNLVEDGSLVSVSNENSDADDEKTADPDSGSEG